MNVLSAGKSTIYRFSKRTDRHRGGQYGWGGNLRTEQVRELVEAAGIELVDVQPRGMFSRIDRARALSRMYRHRSWRPKLHLRHLSSLAGLYCVYAEIFRELGRGGVFMLEEQQDYPAYYAARDFGCSIVVTPQCLETLWPGHIDWVSKRGMPWALEMELDHLKLATAVFFISREEQWLAANRGIRSHYLPYYPPAYARDQLLVDRRRRMEGADRPFEFLVMGTATNPNSVSGLREQANWLVSALRGSNARVHVVGTGTEVMRETWADPLFIFHGLTPPEKVCEIKARVRACLVHFVQGHGALTRIPDMLISGVPVIGNPIACRSAWGYPGVNCYEDLQGLQRLLHTVNGITPLLGPPEEQTRVFQSTLQSLVPGTLRGPE